jgi:transcription-repair coupling factor (superfamily II helicase)
MQAIFRAIREYGPYGQLVNMLHGGRRIGSLGLPRSARLPMVAALHEDLGTPILLLTDRADHALALWEELEVWTRARRHLLAEPNPLFYERAAWSGTARRDRLQAIVALLADRLPQLGEPVAPALVVSSARALMTRTMPPETFLGACRAFTVGMTLQPEAARRELMAAGYARVNVVFEEGQLANRGGILDLWSPAQALPVRLEFFGDEIDTIRTFDPASQRTLDALPSVTVTPAREFLSPASANTAGAEGEAPEASEFDIPMIHSSSAGILDYLSSNALVVVDDQAGVESMMAELEDQAVQLRKASIEDGLLSSDFPLPYVTWSELSDQMQSLRGLNLGQASSESPDAEVESLQFAAGFRHDERFGGRLRPLTEYLRQLTQQAEKVIVVSRQRARLEELWREGGSLEDASLPLAGRPAPVFYEASLREGFVLDKTHLITDSEVFGWERPASRARQRLATETPESVYADLRPDDLVVHIDHGIGRYQGLVQRKLDGNDREYLALEYDGGGQLFVPVHQADRLTRYVSSEGAEPALDRLGGVEWHEKKGRAKGAVLKVAQDMLELHARREVARGHAFAADAAWQAELEDSFPYVETDDQIRALNEIKKDMESARPMDRLLCGDVGYGKTELALRAAFKAVMGGKQVAVLVPTTVLAQQHYETFLERLAAFPVKVEMLSRFRSPREQGEILIGLGQGEIDIVIGTHRLLSVDVQFKDLGLVIIDEEQRFGVSHKEHLKRLRTEVDVLTLTATPIPRTLYMALTGVRDISNLNTPPEERLPIITHVGPYSPKLARQAILRELERGGQVFFVHNRVNTIDAMRVHLSQLVPEARLDVGHGQMPEHQLEDVMHRFNRGHTDILLSTTIIESGLDIPNANTLIVDRADTFGLAQLYQLRGRVGRGASRAYAYFFRHRRLMPTVDAQQRLDVIAENTELGSGYSIAMRDLEIRGAGELLGSQQHGHIQAVGFHLYTRLLADAVRQLRRGQVVTEAGKAAAQRLEGPIWSELSRPISMPVTVDLPLAVGIPSEYIADTDLRLRLYRRIADLRDEAEVDALAGEFTDRFGPLPDMLLHLLYQIRVKLRAELAGLSSVAWEGGQIVLRYPGSGNGRKTARMQDLGTGIRGGRGAYWCSFGRDADWMSRLLATLAALPTSNPPFPRPWGAGDGIMRP